jgi:hypothetical protein
VPPLTSRPIGLLFAFTAITLLFGCEEGGVIRWRVEGAFAPTSLDFGEVTVDDAKALPVSFQNTGNVAFDVVSIDVPDGYTLRGIKADFVGSTIHPAMGVDFEVVFIPTSEGERTAQLVVNISDDEKVVLDLRGVGTRIHLPNIVAMPTSVQFGTIEVGTQATATVELKNEGNAPGTIDRASLANGNTEFRLTTPLPLTIAEGGSQQIELVFAPTSEGVKNDRLTLELVEDVPSVSIDLNGEGKIPLGEILCEPSRVDFGPVERGLVASQSVTCTARGGAARLIGGHIEGATDQFFLPSPPNTNDLTADQSVTIDVEFRPDGLPASHSGELVVDFTGGNGSGSARVTLIGEVIPPPPTLTAISVVLSWNTNNTDIDLHMTQPSNRPNAMDAMFDQSYDCYYANRTPDWGAPGTTTDDPFLDVDDVDGFGPENINLQQTAPGTYDVFVHYFNDPQLGTSNPTVEIHLDGQLAGTFNHPGLQCNEVWHVGTINWTGNSGTFAPVNQVMISSEGWCF